MSILALPNDSLYQLPFLFRKRIIKLFTFCSNLKRTLYKKLFLFDVFLFFCFIQMSMVLSHLKIELKMLSTVTLFVIFYQCLYI